MTYAHPVNNVKPTWLEVKNVRQTIQPKTSN